MICVKKCDFIYQDEVLPGFYVVLKITNQTSSRLFFKADFLLVELFDSGLTQPARFAELLRFASASAAFLAHCNWVERTDKLAWEIRCLYERAYFGRI
jgi:hypothetical protein